MPVKRPPLDDLEHWKATELKNWLLHYSVGVLRNISNPLYFYHWTLLVRVVQYSPLVQVVKVVIQVVQLVQVVSVVKL